MNEDRAPAGHAWPTGPAVPGGYLSADELSRLTLFKWRYSLEALGFSDQQASKLLFLKWLRARGAAQP
jgi:hypothetical protein